MFEMLLGHCVGDYIFQNNWLALNKGKNSFIGWFTCFIHCLIYTTCVCGVMGNFEYDWMILVFFSHFFIDKFSLADKWSKFIGATSLRQFLDDNKNQTLSAMDGLIAGFASFCYAVRDNTFHILIMYYGYKLLF